MGWVRGLWNEGGVSVLVLGVVMVFVPIGLKYKFLWLQ